MAEAIPARIGGQSVLILREGASRSVGREALRSNISAATKDVPLPQKGSKITSFLYDNILIALVGMSIEKVALVRDLVSAK